MIDTDKYQGHAPAPWSCGQATETSMDIFGPSGHWLARVESHSRNSVYLIADAPLLLEEVKRLKIYERLVLCIAYHQQLPDGLYVDEELMLRAREHLRKNGEWEDEEE